MQVHIAPRRHFLRAGLVSALNLAVFNVWALTKPTGKVLLKIKGAITKPNNGSVAEFDMRMLEELPQVTHTVETPWYPRKVSFRGPLLRDVLAAAGASGQTIKAVAINDYAVQIPFSDATNFDVILAIQMNGKAMSSRDKGPIFVIYPYDKFSADEVKRYHDQSVWQLDTLEIQ
jgi:hypothetical protein